MHIFDSHAHYDDCAFDTDRAELLESLPEQGLIGIINAGTTVQSSLQSIRLAQKYPYIFAAVGIHPEEIGSLQKDDINKIGKLAADGKVVAIGEIGLDYHYEGFNREAQLTLFEAQLSLANDLGLPVIIHDRNAHADTMRLLMQYKPRGVLHCFSGSVETAAQAVALGLYLGFTGAVTFKNNRKAASVIASLPRERILVETDCPYMAPEPLRGQRCDSSMLVCTVCKVASLLGVEPDEAAELTATNARALFHLE
jgi:TatD DNase family protein